MSSASKLKTAPEQQKLQAVHSADSYRSTISNGLITVTLSTAIISTKPGQQEPTDAYTAAQPQTIEKRRPNLFKIK